MSFLSRKIGMRDAEKLVMSGDLLSAKKLHEIGVVDVLAPDGQGEYVTQEWIRKNLKRRNGYQAIQHAKKLINPITREELDQIVEHWVDAALRLEEKDIKMMHRIVRSQSRRIQGVQGELGTNLVSHPVLNQPFAAIA